MTTSFYDNKLNARIKCYKLNAHSKLLISMQFSDTNCHQILLDLYK